MEPTTFVSILFKKMKKYLRSDSIRSLCFLLDIDYDELKGDTKTDKIISLIQEALRYNKVTNLIDELNDVAPHVNWPKSPDKLELSPTQIHEISNLLYKGRGVSIKGLNLSLLGCSIQEVAIFVCVSLIIVSVYLVVRPKEDQNLVELTFTPVPPTRSINVPTPLLPTIVPTPSLTRIATTLPEISPSSSPTNLPAPSRTIVPTLTPSATITPSPSPTFTHTPILELVVIEPLGGDYKFGQQVNLNWMGGLSNFTIVFEHSSCGQRIGPQNVSAFSQTFVIEFDRVCTGLWQWWVVDSRGISSNKGEFFILNSSSDPPPYP